jgi:hypothetical protein
VEMPLHPNQARWQQGREGPGVFYLCSASTMARRSLEPQLPVRYGARPAAVIVRVARGGAALFENQGVIGNDFWKVPQLSPGTSTPRFGGAHGYGTPPPRGRFLQRGRPSGPRRLSPWAWCLSPAASPPPHRSPWRLADLALIRTRKPICQRKLLHELFSTTCITQLCSNFRCQNP